MKDLSNLAEEIRQINVANGWKVFLERESDINEYKVPAIVCLIHSEISEAFEEYVERQADKFMFELSDVAIRILDFVGGYENNEFDALADEAVAPDYGWQVSLSDVLLDMHHRCTAVLEAYRKQGRDEILARAADLYVAVEVLALRIVNETDVAYDNLYGFMLAKMQQNRERGYRHGGRKV